MKPASVFIIKQHTQEHKHSEIKLQFIMQTVSLTLRNGATVSAQFQQLIWHLLLFLYISLSTSSEFGVGRMCLQHSVFWQTREIFDVEQSNQEEFLECESMYSRNTLSPAYLWIRLN